jgi:hypothetical protein
MITSMAGISYFSLEAMLDTRVVRVPWYIRPSPQPIGQPSGPLAPYSPKCPEKLSEKSSLASEAVPKEGEMAHREPIFSHSLAANR